MSIPLRSDRVTVFGVLNATPDSFSDGGRFVDPCEQVNLAAGIDAGARLVEAGADVLDVGGESTRPGAREVPAASEIARTAPLIEALAKRFDVPLSIDTRKAAVAETAIDSGASIVNDVSGLRFDPQLAEVVARTGSGLVLGHLRGIPETMQQAPHFDDVLAEVTAELRESVAVAKRAGVAHDALMVDPGIGFGKELDDNLRLLARPDAIRDALALPVMVGPSRKSFLGRLTGAPPEERAVGTFAACAVAVFAGADAVRVHDVAGTRDAVAVALALRNCREGATR